MANRDIKIAMSDSAGTNLSGVTKSATFDTAWYSLNGLEYFGFVLDLGAVSGTSPTLDIDLEFTMDGGTTVFTDFPPAVNDETENITTTNSGISFTQMVTSDQQTTMYWVNPFPNDNNIKIRLECTIAGSSPTFLIDNWYLVARRYGKY